MTYRSLYDHHTFDRNTFLVTSIRRQMSVIFQSRLDLFGYALSITILSMGLLGSPEVKAQSVCEDPPYLGTSGPEICVVIKENPGDAASQAFRGVSPLNIPVTPGTSVTIGDYDVDILVEFEPEDEGHMLKISGKVTRSNGLGAGGLLIEANGGWGPELDELPSESVALQLSGSSTDTSKISLGAALGYPAGSPPGDLGYEPIDSVETQTNGEGEFEETKLAGGYRAGAVALKLAMTAQVNVSRESINLPASAVITVGAPTVRLLANRGGVLKQSGTPISCQSVDDIDQEWAPQFRASLGRINSDLSEENKAIVRGETANLVLMSHYSAFGCFYRILNNPVGYSAQSVAIAKTDFCKLKDRMKEAKADIEKAYGGPPKLDFEKGRPNLEQLCQ